MHRDEPIFIVGVARSGTTLLQVMLGSLPRVAALPELHYAARFLPHRDRWEPIDRDRLLELLTILRDDELDMYEDVGWDFEQIVSQALANGPTTLAHVFRVLMEDFARRSGKARWSEKSPGQLPQSAVELAPDALIVHIIRDPRAALASQIAVPFLPYSPRQLATQWARFNLAAARWGQQPDHAHRYLRIRHEDLVADPEATAKLVCAHIGENFEPTMLAGGKESSSVPDVGLPWQSGALESVRAPSRRHLSPIARIQMAPLVDGAVQTLGYERETRTRRILGRAVNRFPDPTARQSRRAAPVTPVEVARGGSAAEKLRQV
ncbi:MAG: sulfotransferase [Nitriliruptorales bacterium]|nr:sulfotransferase [Nitriliruptorales bacterium]